MFASSAIKRTGSNNLLALQHSMNQLAVGSETQPPIADLLLGCIIFHTAYKMTLVGIHHLNY
jgi:hypothetical protein